MDPKIWGPFMWFILHIITFNYPEKPSSFDKQSYRDFFISLKNIIPCEQCRKHYTKNIQEHPITPHLDNKKNLIEWLIKIHNLVNISLNKRVYTTEEVLETYETLEPISPFAIQSVDITNKINETFNNNISNRERFQKKNKGLYTIIIILIIIVVVLKFIHKKNYYDY